jgi:D-glycero-D-manno-heptose 1,7-bisphosphate phosphatase
VSARAVFLDRDGVINRAVVRDGKPHPPSRQEDLEVLPGVPEALAALKGAGYLLLVVTNQPDVARGAQPREVVDAMHRDLLRRLPLDEVLCCFHDDADACACRKPRPGLLLQAARDRGIDLAASYMVGDRWRDTEAGQAAGCSTLFIDHGYQERRPDRFDARVASLAEAAAWILAGGRT